MSNADPAEVSVVVEREGVTVEKSFEPDDFPVPAIAFVIRSERDVPVSVRLTDAVPDDIEAADIGFHPKYGADHWTNEDGRLVFEREFEAGEEYTTVYGLRARDTESVDRFLGEPELEEVSPGLDEAEGEADDGAEAEDAGAVVSTVMNESGDTTSDDDLEAAIAAVDAGAADDADTDKEESTPDVDDDLDLEATIAGSGADSEEDDEPEASPASTPEVPPTASFDAEDVAAALAEGIRAGTVADEDLETLRDALDRESSGSLEARITHLQTELSDLQAYTGALEEFLDENGDAQTLLEDVQGTVEAFESELDSLQAEVDDLAEAAAEVTDVEEEVSDLGARVQSLDDRMGNVASDLQEVENEVNGLGSELEGVRNGVDSVEREIEAVREEMPDEDVEAMDERIEGIDDRIAELEDELDDLAQMRERMASVFGGGGGAGGEE